MNKHERRFGVYVFAAVTIGQVCLLVASYGCKKKERPWLETEAVIGTNSICRSLDSERSIGLHRDLQAAITHRCDACHFKTLADLGGKFWPRRADGHCYKSDQQARIDEYAVFKAWTVDGIGPGYKKGQK